MSPSRILMANGRKFLIFVMGFFASIIYLTFLIFNYKNEIRLHEESVASLKQSQNKLAAQLQVAQEHKARLQKEVQVGMKSLKTVKDEYTSFRSKAKFANEKLKDEGVRRYDALKQANDLLKGEFDDLTQEHARLQELNKMTMEDCEKESEEHKKALQKVREAQEEDQRKFLLEASRKEGETNALRSKLSALEAVNVDLKESLSLTKSELNRVHAKLLAKEKEYRISKNSNSVANDAFLRSPVNDTNPGRKSDEVITPGKKLASANTGGQQQHNLEVPSIPNKIIHNEKNYDVPPPRVDQKNVLNPQIAKPVADMNNGVDSLVNSPGMMQMKQNVIPKDQDNIQIPHPWAKRRSHESNDSGFRVVGQPVLPQPKMNNNENPQNDKNIPFVNNNLGVIVQPRLESESEKKANVIPFGDHDRQIAVPNIGVQVDNPLEAEGNPNALHQPQLQLNAPDGQVGEKSEHLGGENDDDEDHAFGGDKDYGAGALDKPDRGNQGGAVDGAAVVGAAPPEFDAAKDAVPPEYAAAKFHRLNADFKRKRNVA